MRMRCDIAFCRRAAVKRLGQAHFCREHHAREYRRWRKARDARLQGTLI